MKALSLWTLMTLFCLASVGCVAQREADQFRQLHRLSQEQVLDLQTQLEETRASLAAALAQARHDPNQALLAQIDALTTERNKLQSALDKALTDLRDAAQFDTQLQLPVELSSALEELAALNPDLMTYDAARGMVALRSDLTFGSGSAVLRDGAKGSLDRLAVVLRSPAAEPYEVRIVGHTDNVPISNPTTRQNHPTNWHLSAHRAIGVKDALASAGVPNTRMSVAGYGEFQPVVANSQRGAEANRRVEIFLVARPSGAAAPAAPAAQPAPSRPATPAAPAPAPAPEGPESFK